jgi:hypothetical protein
LKRQEVEEDFTKAEMKLGLQRIGRICDKMEEMFASALSNYMH